MHDAAVGTRWASFGLMVEVFGIPISDERLFIAIAGIICSTIAALLVTWPRGWKAISVLGGVVIFASILIGLFDVMTSRPL